MPGGEALAGRLRSPHGLTQAYITNSSVVVFSKLTVGLLYGPKQAYMTNLSVVVFSKLMVEPYNN